MFCLLVASSTTDCDAVLFFTCALVHLRCFINTNKKFQSYLDLIEKKRLFFPPEIWKRENTENQLLKGDTHTHNQLYMYSDF